ncbi:protein of unknown function [Rhizobiales bacterium GAS191]|nr:protein of unknown function [Rhizobiales bacterium GAS191]
MIATDVLELPMDQQGPLRILALADHWQGANCYAFVRAFRRAGHSVSSCSEADTIPRSWQLTALRVLRRLITPVLVSEYNREVIAAADRLQPDLLFVFKGPYLTADTLRSVKAKGAIAINFFPDTSITADTRYIPRALPLYDWVFTTKSFGLSDMERLVGVRNASFLPHAFDPEVHAPVKLDRADIDRYVSDVSFIGSWSPKKEHLLLHLSKAMPGVKLRVWGSRWEKASSRMRTIAEHRTVVGAEYAKCIRASRISLGLLVEGRPGASSGDLITARTFEIPASGGFMLHERNDEVSRYFLEDRECAMFSDADELVDKVRHYLANDDKRHSIAELGRLRCLESGYSVDARMEQVLAKYRELAASGMRIARSRTDRPVPTPARTLDHT